MKKYRILIGLCKYVFLYVDVERLECFMTEIPIKQKPVLCFAEQINGVVSIRQERDWFIMKEF